MKIGIDLGGSHIAIGVVDSKGKILEKVEKRITQAEKKNIKKVIEDYIIEKTLNFLEQYPITEIGIAIPGTVKNQTIIKSVNLGLKDYMIVKKLQDKIKLEGFTLVPLKLYLKKNKAKILLGVAKGKKTYDKRETIKQRDIERDLRARLKR